MINQILLFTKTLIYLKNLLFINNIIIKDKTKIWLTEYTK